MGEELALGLHKLLETSCLPGIKQKGGAPNRGMRHLDGRRDGKGDHAPLWGMQEEQEAARM